MTNTGILSIIICKFNSKEEFGVIVLFKVKKSLEIDFHIDVLFFYLIVNLKLKSIGRFLFNT